MKLFSLVALTMCAFAANSIFTRAGVVSGTDPMGFAVLRVWAGAVTLAALVWAKGGLSFDPRARFWGALSLIVYLIGFSLAYLRLDAGLGALILFGVVQLAMFGWAVWRGQPVGVLQVLGMGVAFAGLVWVLWPAGGVRVDLASALAMIAAGLGWAAYSVLGQGARAPLVDTAGNFVLAAMLMLPLVLMVQNWTLAGVIWALLSGAVASGLGYALWYAVLPRLATTTAGVAQLSVPVIALCAGALFLGEAMTPAHLAAAAVVLGGIGLSVLGKR